MRARRSSSSDSGVSIVNERIAVASADRSAVSAMSVLLGEDGGEGDGTQPARLVRTPRPSRTLGLLTGLLTGLLVGLRSRDGCFARVESGHGQHADRRS